MAASNRFPAFITDEYRPGNGFAEFEQSARASGERTRRQFEQDFSAIKRIAQDALSVPRTAGGSLDLNVGQYKAAAVAAEAHASALRQIETAAIRAAKASGDTSEETRRYIVAANAAAVEAEELARGLNKEAVAMERLQKELNQTTSETTDVITSQRALRQAVNDNTFSARQNRFAYVQLGQQMQDVVIQAQAGVNPFQILVQQGTQAAFAMTNFGGRLGAVARFLSGPWGTAIFIGIAAVGSLIGKMKDGEKAAKDIASAVTVFGEAQSALGNLFDLTTGRIKDQTSALRELEEITRAQIQLDSIRMQQEALANRSQFERLRAGLSEQRGSGDWVDRISGANAEAQEILRVFDEVEKRSKGGDRDAMRQGIERLKRIVEQGRGLGYKLTTEDGKGLADILIRGGMADLQENLAKRITDSLTGGLDPAFKNKGPNRSNQIAELENWAKDAVDRIDAIVGGFEDAPKALERARKALADVDAIMRDVEDKQRKSLSVGGGGLDNYSQLVAAAEAARAAVRGGLIRDLADEFEKAPTAIDKATEALKALQDTAALPGFENFRGQIEEAGEAIRSGVLQPLDKLVEVFDRQYRIQELLISGKEAEAEVQRRLNELMDSYGVDTEDLLQQALTRLGYEENIRDVIVEQVNATREQTRALEQARREMEPYLNAAADLRSNIQATIEGGLGGRGVAGSIKDFLGGVSDNFNRLFSETVTERLFGGIFRKLEDQIRGETPAEKAEKRLAGSMDGAKTSLDTLSTATETGAERLAMAMETAADRILAAGERLSSGPAAVASSGFGIGNPLAKMLVGGDNHARHVARGSHGVDLRAAVGTALLAPFAGTLSTSQSSKGGLQAFVTSLDGRIKAGFAHLNGVVGDLIGKRVGKGQQIGRTGASGGVDPHLHGSLRIDGKAVDPMKYYGRTIEGLGPVVEVTDRLSSLSETVAALAEPVDRTQSAVSKMVETLADSENVLPGGTVTGTRVARQLSPVELLNKAGGELGQKIAGPLGKSIGRHLGDIVEGRAYGQMASNFFLGRGGSSTGAAVGGALGNIAGKAIEKSVSKGLENAGKTLGALGGLGGPLGSIVGGLAGGLIGKAFTSSKTGTATVALDANGNLKVASAGGNSSKFRQAAGGSADAAIATVERIAEALGGTLTGAGSVSIGIRDGKYRVDTSGRGVTKTKKGAIDFGEDAEAAVRFATLDLIKDGIIGGLRAGTQQLLRNSKDLDAGLDRALRFESVFTRLKEHLDPTGAAMDALNKEFTGLQRLFRDAGASVEELAQLEQLYGLERKRIMEETASAGVGVLKSLLDDLTVNNDALSLRDRLAAARAKYDPLKADYLAGKAIDFDAFAESGRAVEQIIRMIEGSGSGYFAFLDELTGLTRKMIAGQENVTSLPRDFASPFGSGGSDGAAPVVGAIDGLSNRLVAELGGHLSAVNDNLGTLIAMTSGGPSSAESGPRRNF